MEDGFRTKNNRSREQHFSVGNNRSRAPIISWNGWKIVGHGTLKIICYFFADGKKGLTSGNIVFTHSPFWVQLWGSPFEIMSEVVGQDIGNSMGCFLETDKRAHLSEQEKYLCIRVDSPIDKPLRRGGNVVGIEGDKYWVHYKYEWLPTFCYICGLMGHDAKHCHVCSDRPNAPHQYGEWLRVFGTYKGGSNGPKNFSKGSNNTDIDTQSGEKGQLSKNVLQSTPASHGGESTSNGSLQNSKIASKSDQIWGCDGSDSSARQVAESGIGLDNSIAGTRVLRKTKVPCDEGSGPIQMEVFGSQGLNGDMLSNVG